jgi:chromosome segregation protein
VYKLKKLELIGFKSFADRSRLEFADGIAAIVGPNGCGKSNLSDAIAWVLGEQSARILRGERMADVIFSGTGTRPPTSMAEVSMVLVDPEYVEAESRVEDKGSRRESDAPSDAEVSSDDGIASSQESSAADATHSPRLNHRAGEITVTRRLFRDGESEYLINGETCRLRDVQDLFMGTGLGPESYAIIEQGRIGQILSSKPGDRRLILEEAAGVSKFKTRKRLAEAKLESSRQNLSRITDILEEVSKQVNSLKRQASKARRYKELHMEWRERLKVVLTSRLIALDEECQRLSEDLAAIQSEYVAAAGEAERLEQEQLAASLRHEELESELTQLRERLAQGDLARQRLASRIEQVEQQRSGLEARAEDSGKEMARLEGQLGVLQQRIEDNIGRLEEVKREQASAEEAAAGLTERKESVAASLAECEKETETCRELLLEVVSRGAELRNQLVQAEEMSLSLERQAARAQTERAGAEEEQRRISCEFEVFQSAQARGASELEDLARSLAQVSAEAEQARAEAASLREDLDRLRQDRSAAAARKEALEETLARHAYTTESVRRLLAGVISTNGHSFRPLGLLADFVEVSSGYEEVVEEFLRYELDCVVVERHEEARSGLALLRAESTGRSTFFVTRIPSNGHAHDHGRASVSTEPGVLAALKDLVRFEPRLGLNGDLPLPALANAYLVESPSVAEQLAIRHPDCHFLTPTGEHYHHRLVSGGQGASSGPLALRRDFRELERRTTELANAVQAGEARLSEVTLRATNLEQQVRNLEGARLEAEKKTVVANEKLRQLREESEKATGRLRLVEGELAAVEKERAVVGERLRGLGEQLALAGAEKLRREEEVGRRLNLVRELRSQLDLVNQELIAAQARASALEARTQAAEDEHEGLLAQADEVRSRLRQLQEQIKGWREDQRRLGEESEAARRQIDELEREQVTARGRLHELELESESARQIRDELRPQVESARAALEGLRAKRSEAEIALARADSDRSHWAQQCRDELHAEPSQLLAELKPEAALSGGPLQAAEEELRAMKERLESMGPVNMMALEELQEAEERFTFLETQRQDLLASIEDTAQAIREIDQVSRQQFMEAFRAINAYFAESFRTLFGGGIGEMRLSDESDPDSGLDIVAQPPGKRLQNVLLLSGGEKALAALALLIAIFRYTPSPFCILDEVDAPLDESNVDRFTRLIREMGRHTQFILITHNKRTMEMASMMYGVTMEEPGVSKLVSVRFDEIEEEEFALTAPY